MDFAVRIESKLAGEESRKLRKKFGKICALLGR
jgi:hypothetical protein